MDLELSGADLEEQGDGLEVLPTPITAAEAPRPRRPSQLGSAVPPPPPAPPPSPLDRTMPPQPRVPVEELGPLPESEEELEAEPEPMESAPTRVEREEDIIAAHSGTAPLGGPRLLIIGGNNRGKEFPLKLAVNSIGRGMDNDVVLADIAVSRKHTLVCFEGNQFVVRDLGSGNGTLLNSKRVDTTPLQDGDQLELGNTLLRFVNPVAAQPLAQMSTVITPRDAIDGLASSPAVKTLDIPGRGRERTAATVAPGSRFRKRLLIFGSVGVIALLALMIGVKAILVSRQKQQQPTAAVKKPDEVLAEAFREGISEFNSRNWEKAREHFLKVLALAPNQGSVRQYVDKAGAEILARDALAKAKTHVDARRFVDARQELAKIKRGPGGYQSSYQAEADALAQKLESLQVKALCDEARGLREKGELAAALEKVREAQGISPANTEARALASELADAQAGTKKGGKPDKPVKPDRPVKPDKPDKPVKHAVKPDKPVKHAVKPDKPVKPEKPDKPIKLSPSGQGKAAIALYKKRQFGPAYEAMNQFAAAQPAKKQKAAKALAKAIYDVGQNWARADKVAGNPSQALQYYRAALAADAKIEKGSHQKALKEQIVKAARAAAASELARKNYRAAYQAVQAGQQAGGNDPGLQKVVAALELRAQEIFNKGYTIHKSNLAGARRLWQEVLQMVPKSSAIYRKAYDYLNSGGRGSQDEDED